LGPHTNDFLMQYIGVLRKCKMKARVKSARQAMYARFPLAEPLWVEWLEDETAAATSPAAGAEVERLFQLAVQDYLSINIWAKYLQCALSLCVDTCGWYCFDWARWRGGGGSTHLPGL